MTPQAFLELFWHDKPESLYVQPWALQNKRSYCCLSLSKAARFLETCAQSHYDAYCSVGLSPRDYGPDGRCPGAEISAIGAVWSDRDMASPLRPGKKLPRTIAEANLILPAVFPPTLIIHSGYGLQDYWQFRELWIFTSDQEREQAHQLVYDWQTIIRFQSLLHDWNYDRLADLGRLLRVPGTFNFKDPANPKPVEVVEFHPERRYNPSELREYLDSALKPSASLSQDAPPPLRPVPRAASPGARNTNGFLLDLDPEARIPDEVLEGWMQVDPRFRRTWHRERSDLADQSASGYDLALANFGLEAGLDSQQIAHLIIHWRRKHSARPRTRMDYFYRTIERARTTTGRDTGAARGPATASADAITDADAVTGPAAPAALSPPPPPGPPADPLRILASELGIPLERIVKIPGSEPAYHLEITQETIELPGVSHLIEQGKLRQAIAKSSLHLLIPRFKANHWDRLAQMLLNAAVETTVPDLECQLKGSIAGWLDSYLRETSFIPGVEDQPSQALRAPLVLNGQIAINSRHLQAYLRGQGQGPGYSIAALTSALQAIGATPYRLQGPRIKEQSRWLLPAQEFPPQISSLNTAEAAESEPKPDPEES